MSIDIGLPSARARTAAEAFLRSGLRPERARLRGENVSELLRHAPPRRDRPAPPPAAA